MESKESQQEPRPRPVTPLRDLYQGDVPPREPPQEHTRSEDEVVAAQKRELERKITGLWKYAADLQRINAELGKLNYRETTRRGLNREEQERRRELIKEQRTTTGALLRDYGVRTFAGIEKAVAACQSMLTRLELQQQTHHERALRPSSSYEEPYPHQERENAKRVQHRQPSSFKDLFNQPDGREGETEQQRKQEHTNGRER
jgi:hypothetical protein